MSASKKSGGCKQCDPCSKGKSGKRIKSSGSGSGSGTGQAVCPAGAGGSGGPGASAVNDMNCNMDDACAKDLARQIDEKICNAMGNPWFWDPEECYDCSNVQVNVAGKCKCGKWQGSIGFGQANLPCQSVPCGARPV